MNLSLPTSVHAELRPEAIFEEYAPRVYNLARRLLGNAADAEDVTQNVFLQVVRKLGTFRGEASFSTWLYRVAFRAALDYRRRRARREENTVADPLESFREDGSHDVPVHRWSTPPDQELLDRELHDLIEKGIDRLPVIYRDVYVLADLENLPGAEIAELLGMGLPAVKSRLHRARLLMRDMLAPHFEEERP